MSIYRRSKTSLIIFKNYIFKQFFSTLFSSVSARNSMGGVLCSAVVSEALEMRKSLGIHY